MLDLPKDSMMLLSFINTQLRDNFDSLNELCAAFDVDESIIVTKLKEIDYEYDEKLNKFV